MRERTSLTEDDIDAIADAVVEKAREVLLIEVGKMVWSAVRKLVIAGAVGLFALEQLKVWLK